MNVNGPRLSPNVATLPNQAALLPANRVAVITGRPVLAEGSLVHKVQIPGLLNQSRLAAVRLALTDEDAQRILAYARSTHQLDDRFPSVKLIEQTAPEGLTRHGTTLRLDDPARNHLTGRPNFVSQERMHLPGTSTEVPAFVHELYEVRPLPEPTRATTTAGFFKQVARVFNNPKEPSLSDPRHLGTVAAFEIGERRKYMLYRQLENAQSPSNVPQGKRKLMIAAHGSEAPLDNSTFPLPTKVPLPNGIAFSQAGPSGFDLALEGKRQLDNSQFVGLLDQLRGKPRAVSLQSHADLRAHWPVYSEHRLQEGEHSIRFLAKNLVPGGGQASPAHAFTLATGLDAAQGQGHVRNQLFSALEDLKDVPIQRMALPPGHSDPSSQRADVTPDGLAFAALNEEHVPAKVDVLALEAGSYGSLEDVLEALRRHGILDQYDEILSTACRSSSSRNPASQAFYGEDRSWHVTENRRTEAGPATHLNSGAQGVAYTAVNPGHQNQVSP